MNIFIKSFLKSLAFWISLYNPEFTFCEVNNRRCWSLKINKAFHYTTILLNLNPPTFQIYQAPLGDNTWCIQYLENFPRLDRILKDLEKRCHLYLYIYIYIVFACLSVHLYPINVKTAEPIGPTFCVEPHIWPKGRFMDAQN